MRKIQGSISGSQVAITAVASPYSVHICECELS